MIFGHGANLMKRKIIGIILSSLSIYTFIILISSDDGINKIGIIGNKINDWLYLFFGIMSFFIVLIFLGIGIYLVINRKKILKGKIFALFLLYLGLSILIILISVNKDLLLKDYTHQLLKVGGSSFSGGLLISVILTWIFPYIGKIGIIILDITLLIISIWILFNDNIGKFLQNLKLKKEESKRFLAENKTKEKSKEDSKENGDDILKKYLPDIEKLEVKQKEHPVNVKRIEELGGSFYKNLDKKIDRENMMNFLKEKAVKLEEVLLEYKISGKVKNFELGPAISRLELEIEKGIRVKKVVTLSDDIAMKLSAKSIRIEAPIPGKNLIGLEIPNDNPEIVYFGEIIDSFQFKNNSAKLLIGLGKDIVGKIVVINLKRMPHILIAGRTGSGKSVCINLIIASILIKSKEDEVKFIMIDPKMVELAPFNDIPHLLCPVITDPKSADIALKWVVDEMEERYKKLSKIQVRNIENYNLNVDKNNKMPYIVVIIDELADLMMSASSSVENSIVRIAQKARAIGIHLVVATQRPSVDVITGTIKANLPTRISFAVASQIDSRTIIDCVGAEKLLGRGDMLYSDSNSSKIQRMQAAFISDQEIQQFTDKLKQHKKPSYNVEILKSKDEKK